jgi:hypothetical protein
MSRRPGLQGGFTLIELMVAIGMGITVTFMVSTLTLQTLSMQRQMRDAMEREDLRNIIRQKLRCDMPCAKIAEDLPKRFGRWSLEYSCRSLTRGIHPTMRLASGKAGDKAESPDLPVFEITDGYPCHGRMPANCVYGCHWSGEMLGNRGYLYPPLGGRESNVFLGSGEGTSAAIDKKAACIADDFFGAQGRVVGVDFATGRVVCADDRMFGPPGPLCKTIYESGDDRTFTVTINGPMPCIDYSQIQAREFNAVGQLKIQLGNGFRPDPGDTFTVVLAESVAGRFPNAPRGIDGPFGHFDVAYSKNKIELAGYRPPPRPSH